MHYDPMISKLCTWAPSREEAIERMKGAIDNYVIHGVQHNAAFCRDVCNSERFVSGELTTDYIKEEYPEGFTGIKLTPSEHAELVVSSLLMECMTNDAMDTSSGSLASFDSVDMSAAVVTVDGHEPVLTELDLSEEGEMFARLSGEGIEETTVNIADVDWTVGTRRFQHGTVTVSGSRAEKAKTRCAAATGK